MALGAMIAVGLGRALARLHRNAVAARVARTY
jgi:hypothetical protein